jgi:acetoin utilization deacetylase AcuC-like enzyme
MKVVRSDDHRQHFPAGELHGGRMVRPFECPERVDYINAALHAAGLSDVVAPEVVSDDLLAQVHDEEYLSFIMSAWKEWSDGGGTTDLIPMVFPGRRMQQRVSEHIDGRLGFYAFAAETSISNGTWEAAHAAASIASTGQRLVSNGESAAFALCRPPGHHAAIDYFGGYCYLNNAAIAAQGFLNDGAERVAVLDVDFHHGNGTQDIFYGRSDVFFASIHGDPLHTFPHYLGFVDETGSGAGAGYNANYPLVPGTAFDVWIEALEEALARIIGFAPEALVVSLGVDTFEADPISSFKLTSDDFSTYGRRLGNLGLPTLYCMEGGYAVEEIGINTVNVLTGHLSGRC